MVCPYCGEAMEAGVIQSPHEISWSRKKHILNRAELHEGSVVLSELSFLKGSAVKAFCCRNCQKIIIDFKKGDCDLNQI